MHPKLPNQFEILYRILPCSSGRFITIGQLKWILWTNEILRDLSLRWVSEGYPISQQPSGFLIHWHVSCHSFLLDIVTANQGGSFKLIWSYGANDQIISKSRPVDGISIFSKKLKEKQMKICFTLCRACIYFVERHLISKFLECLKPHIILCNL